MIWLILVLAVASLSLMLWIAFHPVLINDLKSHPDLVHNYYEAITRVQAMQEDDNKDLAWDVCITKLLDHGIQTEHVIVLLHGFTTCPEQFHELGKQYFEAGYNVLIPRMPFHGLSDRMTNELVHLTAENLAAFGDRVLDVAHGLGKKVSVMGLSGSGTLVCWLAQNRSDLDFAFAIAPLFGLAFIPARFTKLFERVASLLPNFYLWWDPRTKAENPYSIYYAYPGYPLHALVEIMRLGMIVRIQAEKSAPAARHVVAVLNEAEPAISNVETDRILQLWKRHGNADITEYHFEKEMNLPHDIITPGTPNLPIELIHPRLVAAVKDIHASR
jgi:alpha-beta hydrolase superfamily lysophospholipase